MNDPFTVDLEQLDSVVARLTGLAGFLNQRLQELDRQVAQLGGSWIGVAAAAHAQAHREWAAGAQELHEGLDDMREAAAHAHGRYTDAVDVNLQMLGRRPAT